MISDTRYRPLRRPRFRVKPWSGRTLEPRLLLAGDAGAEVVGIGSMNSDSGHLQTSVVHHTADDQASSIESIVFIDPAVDDLDSLISNFDPASEIVLLRSDQSGIAQISEHLSRQQNLKSIHLIGHGDRGQIRLGDQVLDRATLREHENQVSAWKRSLSSEADILIYGCRTGAGLAGTQFIQTLGELTGADIAASDDLTGSALHGGDWELEMIYGVIETASVFDSRYVANYSHTLAIEIRAAGTTNEESFDLQINQQSVATFNNVGGDANAGVFETYSYNANGVDPNLVRILFLNDVYEPAQGIDRNLRIDSISVDGQVIETESPEIFSTGTWKPEDGIVPGFRESEFLHSNGYFQYSGTSPGGSSVVVTASGDNGQENFDLQIDGATVASYQSIGTGNQDFTYNATTQISPDQVRIVFTNDVYEPSQDIDYNLNIDKITIDGTEYQTESPSVFSTGTWKPEDGIVPGFRESETLHTDGYFQYADDSIPVPPTIRINAGGGDYVDTSGNLWQADAYYDGGQVFTTTADILQTEDDTLYQTERWNQDLSYDVPVENGTYSVDLHFAEIYFDDFGQRIFDVELENSLVADDLDIYERARNAFFPGNNNALVINAPQVIVSDGILDLDMSASVNNAKLSAIEITPTVGPGVLLQSSGGNTTVTENGLGDSYSIRLNSQPSSDVTVNLQTDFSQIGTSSNTITFTPSNWASPQDVGVSAVNDGDAEGTQFIPISHSVSSADSTYNNFQVADLVVSVIDDDTIPIQFQQKTIASIDDPTTAAFGPDGRLYVGSTTGIITALTLNENNDVIASEQITTLSGLSNNNILGLAFNPFSNSSSPEIYVSHSQLFANGGSSFPETELSPYSGQVSVLGGSQFSSVNELISGLPVSNHDHGINGLAFDNAGDLYIAVGGNTNAGITNSALGGIPESPFSAAVLKADIREANFNGQIEYNLIDGFDPPPGLPFDASDSQTWGDKVTVASGVDVRVYSAGLRNPYDIVFTTDGLLYATDNGPNQGFGDVSTGPNTQQPVTGAPDELNLLSDGGYFGHPNRTRGASDPIQNIYFGPDQLSSGQYIGPLTTLPSSTNGIDEYRSTTFGGQLTGQLLTQHYNGQVIWVERSSDGFSVIDTQSMSEIADGLDVLTGVGGTIFGIDFAQDRVTVASPVDNSVTTAKAYDISQWRALSSGGQVAIIGGVNFGNIGNTDVTIGGVQAQVTSVTQNQIQIILPAFSNPLGELLDVIVTSNGQTSVLENAFLPLV